MSKRSDVVSGGGEGRESEKSGGSGKFKRRRGGSSREREKEGEHKKRQGSRLLIEKNDNLHGKASSRTTEEKFSLQAGRRNLVKKEEILRRGLNLKPCHGGKKKNELCADGTSGCRPRGEGGAEKDMVEDAGFRRRHA